MGEGWVRGREWVGEGWVEWVKGWGKGGWCGRYAANVIVIIFRVAILDSGCSAL